MKLIKSNLLICAYNKPDSLQRLLQSPALNYFENVRVVVDGPTDKSFQNQEEVIKVCRQLASKFDVRIRELNLGLYHGMRTAISEMFMDFKHVTVLEEDCLPSPFIPKYLDDFQRSFKDEFSESHISLSRHVQKPLWRNQNSVSKYPFVWGWASSRQVWQESSIEADKLDGNKLRSTLENFPSATEEFISHWLDIYKAASEAAILRRDNKLDEMNPDQARTRWVANSWATPYTLGYWTNNEFKYSRRPAINLIQNIGFNSEASHTLKKPRHARKKSKGYFFDATLSEKYMFKYDTWEDKYIYGI